MGAWKANGCGSHTLECRPDRKMPKAKISAGKLDKYEEPCMENCVNRFLDTSGMILKHMESMRTG